MPFAIRPEQLIALETASLTASFAEELTRLFPRHAAALGPDGVRETVRHGLERAASYGIDFVEGYRAYLGLMFAFGRDFDTDRRLRWPAAILNDPGCPDGLTRVRQLVEMGRMALVRILPPEGGVAE